MLEIVVSATLQLQTMRRVVVIKVSQYDHKMPQSDITDNPKSAEKRHSILTATWYQEDYLSKAASSLFQSTAYKNK